MLRLMETHPAAAVERAVTAALERHFAAPGDGAAHPSAAAGRPAAGVPAGRRRASRAGADRGAVAALGRAGRPASDSTGRLPGRSWCSWR